MKKGMAALVIIWLTIVVSLYYVSHDPINSILLINIGLGVWQIFLGLLILLFCMSLGIFVFPKMKTFSFSHLSIVMLLGIGITSPILYLLGSIVGVGLGLAWSLIILGLLLLRKQVFQTFSIFKVAWQEIKPNTRLSKLIIWIIGLYVFFELFIALSPAIHFDALMYHFTIPQQFLAEGNISYLPNNIYWGFPQIINMLYLWFLALGGQQAAILSYLIGCFSILAVWSLANEIIGQRYAWVATACLMSGYSLVRALSTGYLAWSSILVGVAFLSILINLKNKTLQRSELWLGIIAGVAFGIKFTNGYLFLIGFLFLLGFKSKKIGNYLLGAAIFAFPWLIKNYLATGNPVYPLLFPSSEMSLFRLSIFQGNQLLGNWMDIFLLPIRATLFGIDNAQLGDAPAYLSSVGPLILGFSVFAFLGWGAWNQDNRYSLKSILWVSILGLITWAIAGRLGFHLSQTRFYYSIFPALAIFAAVGFAGIEKIKIGNIRLGRIASSFLIIVSLLNLSQIAYDTIKMGAIQKVFGVQSSDTYIKNNLGQLALVNEAIVNLPEDSRVLMLWEPREFYCAPVCEADEILDRWILDFKTYGNPSSIKNSWVQEGYSHVVLYNSGVNFLRQNGGPELELEWEALEKMLLDLDVVQDFKGAYTLYTLLP